MQMKKVAPVLCVSCTALVLAGCSGLFSREPAGGTLTGSFGAVPGSVAARAMGDDDRRRVANALDALANGESSAWRNRETGDSICGATSCDLLKKWAAASAATPAVK